MGRAQTDQLTEVPETRELEVRKEDLRSAGRAVDPLKPLRDHPFLTVGAAAMLGATVGSPAAANRLQSIVSSGILRAALAAGKRLKNRWISPPSADDGSDAS